MKLSAEAKLARVHGLLEVLREKAYIYFGGCATGFTDYAHSHSWASDCSACGERAEASRMLQMLENALAIDPKDRPCFLTEDKCWCVSHNRPSRKCEGRKS